MALAHWLQLALTDGIGPILTRRLIDAAGSAAAACDASIPLLRTIEGIGAAKAGKIHTALREARSTVDQELRHAEANHVRLICPDDADYPLLLRSIPDPPAVLYVRGTLEPRDLNALAIVGSRRCSHYGREQAERFAALLAGAGMTIVSGGARGIDSAAHRGAMSHPHGRTLAVLGCGIDVAYPPENESLFKQFAQHGAVITEYPFGTQPLAENFPRRNRIVSGLARGVLVVEADERSGALITARQAADDHNRPVFALPGRVDNRMSAGPHRLIRDGAALVTGLDDILDALDPLPQEASEPMLFKPDGDATESPASEAPPVPVAAPASAPALLDGLSETQRLILQHMGDDPAGVDLIHERTDLPAPQILGDLTLLSLRGLVRRVEGQTYIRR